MFGEDGTITFVKKEENAAAGADAEKTAPEGHGEAEGTPAADAGDNASGEDAAA